MARLPQPGNDKGTWGNILNDYLLESHDANGTIKTNAVGPTQLAPNAVTSSALAPNSVTSSSIANGSINTASLSADIQSKINTVAIGVADGSISATQLADGSVTNSKLAPSIQTSIASANSAVQTINNKTGQTINLVATDLGLGNVSNTSDTNKPISTATQAALNLKSNITSLSTVATTGSYTDLLNKPVVSGSPVTSVASRTGDIVLTAADVNLGNVNNTSDANKPISSATQTALNLKATTSSLSTAASTGSYTDLINKPTIPTTASQVGAVPTTGLDASVATNITTSNSATATALTGLYATSSSVSAKYTKPGSGIPLSDLASNVQAELSTSPNYVRAAKAANTSVTSSTAMTTDPDLTVSVGTNGKYAFELLLAYEADTGSGIKLEFVAPTGCSIFGIGFGVGSTNIATSVPGASMTIQYASFTNSAYGVAGGVGAGTAVGYRISGTLTTGSTAGTFGLAWAQGTSSSTSTVLYTGSELSVTKVA